MAKSKTKFKIEIIVIELLLICALLGVLFVKKVESYHFDSDATYFLDAMDYIVPAGSVAKVDSKTKDITIERNKDFSLEATGTPVYYNEIPKLVLMKDLAYIKPANGVIYPYRLSYFTEISIEPNGVSTIMRDTNSKLETDGFLFDGNNTYVFLEDTYLEYSNKRVSLPAFSYVTVLKDNYVEFFDYNSKQITLENTEYPVYARNLNDSYKVNLTFDIVSFNSGDVMLHSYVDNYDPYFEAD